MNQTEGKWNLKLKLRLSSHFYLFINSLDRRKSRLCFHFEPLPSTRDGSF